MLMLVPLLLSAADAAREVHGETMATANCAGATPYLVPEVSYVAVRRLEAENPKSGRVGWLEARTALQRGGTLQVDILAEGGSESIRNRVLRATLKAEQAVASSLDHADARYECGVARLDSSGLLRLPVRPIRPTRHVVVGDMFLHPATGEVVRVAGRLAKSPSFWVSRVDVEWTYARVHREAVLPVELHSTASVKIFGHSRFRMTYRYETVDGEPVPPTFEAPPRSQ
jgi:hypothetical protein